MPTHNPHERAIMSMVDSILNDPELGKKFAIVEGKRAVERGIEDARRVLLPEHAAIVEQQLRSDYTQMLFGLGS